MKLYTEEQVKNLIVDIIMLRQQFYPLTEEMGNKLIEKYTPIELPSDEEIEKELLFGDMIEGAKWMKEQILNQNNRVSTQDPATDKKETDIKKGDINFMYKWIREKSGK